MSSRTINGVTCLSCDWTNCIVSVNNNSKLAEVVAEIQAHPMQGCVSIPFLFSYNYKTLCNAASRGSTAESKETLRYKACLRVLQTLNAIA